MKFKYIAFLVVVSFFFYIPKSFASACENGTSLSMNEAADAQSAGTLSVNITIDYTANKITADVKNDTQCAAPISLAVYKMFGPFSQETLSTQQFFSESGTALIQASSSKSLEAEIPACMSQYDVYYGDSPKQLVDNQYYPNLLKADQIRLEEPCTNPPVNPPPVATSTDNIGTTTETTPTPPPTVSKSRHHGGTYIRPPQINQPVLAVAYNIPPEPVYVQLPDSGFGPEMTDKIMLYVMSVLLVLALWLFRYSIKLVRATK